MFLKNYQKCVTLLILLPPTLAAPHNESKPRIIGGYPCDTIKVPFFVIIISKHGCGGSLLTYDWVLTAAHCMLPEDFKGITARVHSGFDRSPELKQVRSVKEIHSHPSFVAEDFFKIKDIRYDIGLILVNEPFHQTAAAHIVTIPAVGFTKTCNRVLATGIGLTYNNENTWGRPLEHRPLKCVNLSIVDTNTCKKLYSGIGFDDTIICTHEPGKDTCGGDSGGPIFCNGVIIGVVSLGPTECGATEDSPATYTKVESYYGFIEDVTGLKMKKVSAIEDSFKPHVNIVQAWASSWTLVLLTVLFWFVH